MKIWSPRVVLTGLSFLFFLQITPAQSTKLKQTNLGQWYVYWGWNGSQYTKSNIRFEGPDHDFVLNGIIADDRQTNFTIKKYFHPAYFTTPQYNFRIGKFLKNNWDVSLGIDHMKYVVRQGQTVNVAGDIQIPGTEFIGTYANVPIAIEKGFLEYEHTDGLNYINLSFRKEVNLVEGKFDLDFFVGSGVGVLVPKSDVTLINRRRHDALHLAGYGLDLNTALRLTYRGRLFIQSEFKGGIINLPSVRTTLSKDNGAKQNFGFVQYNIVFGGNMFLKKKISQE